MSNIKKYCVLGAVFALTVTMANAEITVKDTVSPEFIHNQGYSSEVSRVIDVRATKDPLTPIAQEEGAEAKKFRFYLWKTLDPAVNRKTDWLEHDIQYNNSVEDL